MFVSSLIRPVTFTGIGSGGLEQSMDIASGDDVTECRAAVATVSNRSMDLPIFIEQQGTIIYTA
jgi:hypothetical protein